MENNGLWVFAWLIAATGIAAPLFGVDIPAPLIAIFGLVVVVVTSFWVLHFFHDVKAGQMERHEDASCDNDRAELESSPHDQKAVDRKAMEDLLKH